MNKPEIYIFGETLFDCFPNDEPIIGGAPLNVAWHLKGFGEEPKLVSAVGQDALGDQLKSKLDQWGLDLEYLQTIGNYETGRVNVTVEEGEPSYEICDSVAWDYISKDAMPKLNEGFIYHGSLALRSQTSRDALEKIIKESGSGVNTIVDVNLRDPWWDPTHVLPTLTCGMLVKVNEHELHRLNEHTYGDLPENASLSEKALHFKMTHNIVNLLVTKGKEGAILYDAYGEQFTVSPLDTHLPLVDAVGAGDAFSSVVIVGLMHNWDWSNTLERAQHFASFIVTQRGATVSDKSLYEDFRKLWNIV